jgi:hypothetical protein
MAMELMSITVGMILYSVGLTGEMNAGCIRKRRTLLSTVKAS